MKDERSTLFYAYRYFIIHSGQQSLFKEKRELIKELVDRCILERKLEINIENRKHLLIHARTFSDNVQLFKFSKDIPVTKFMLDEKTSDIIESKESNYPFIFIFIDTSKQMILLEKKTSVYNTIKQSEHVFKTFVDSYYFDPNYTFTMDEITDNSSFWSNIERSEKIYELTLNLKSPNLFGGILETNSFLKKVKEKLNNEETDIKVKNSKGELTINHETLDDPLKYASSGGGHWELKLKRKGRSRKTVVKSECCVKTIEVTRFEEEYTMFPEHGILEKIKNIDELLD